MNKFKIPILIWVVFSMFLGKSSFAYTGNEMLRDINITQKANAGQLITKKELAQGSTMMGYVDGLLDAHDIYFIKTDYNFFCRPNSSTVNQLIDVVGKYLKENPKIRHVNAGILVLEALQEAYPCPE